jgi:2,5-diamino-6-(ribosylamino)-4(3H)-pyrimidinone 5'-phosphate reductase
LKVIVHNSVSLDGSLLGFAVDMTAHYRVAGGFRAGIHLVGSNTALAGLKLFHKKLPSEQEQDLCKPRARARLPLWVIPDSQGKLKGKLHVLRQSRLCRDAVILTTSATPKGYLRYLTERGYDWHYMGNGPINYGHAFEVLAREYRARVLLSDSGPMLNGILLNAGLVDEVSLLVHPFVVGAERLAMFAGVKNEVTLRLAKSRTVAGKPWLLYRVIAPRRGK